MEAEALKNTESADVVLEVEDDLSDAELEFIANDLSADARWSLNPSRTEAKCC